MASLRGMVRVLVTINLLLVLVEIAASSVKGSTYPCVGTSPCAKKFLNQIWKRDKDFFLLNITGEEYAKNCTEAQVCLNDVTGGGGIVSDITNAAVSFIFDVCKNDRQERFYEVLNSCILKEGIHLAAESLHSKWLTDRDNALTIITASNGMTKFCGIAKEYASSIEKILIIGGCPAGDINWCMKIIRENLYEKYGGYCPCVGNCDCTNKKSVNTVSVGGNGSGVGYMILIFGIMFSIGAILVKMKSTKRK